jgi:hypothetical protein
MRDLDDLLDSVVSRRASAAARTPDFAAVERRGQQRRRRARASAVGAVVAVVAVVSVVGTQVASDRADTAPAGTIEWEGPDGELGRAVEAGKADSAGVVVSADGSMLTRWNHFTGSIDPDDVSSAFVEGVSLAVDGTTYWSPLAYKGVEAFRLASGAFVVSLNEAEEFPARLSYYVADASGIRPIDLVEGPADLASGVYDGYVWMYAESSPSVGIYAVDVETATASLVSELTGVVPDTNDPSLQLPQTDDGELWVVADRPDEPAELVNMAPDGELTRYPMPPGSMRTASAIGIRALTVSQDGRLIMLWDDGRINMLGELLAPQTRMLTTVSASGTVSTVELGDPPQNVAPTVAPLPDGRLLIDNSGVLMRSSDETWRHFETVAPPEGISAKRLRSSTVTASDHSVCLTPSPYFGDGRRGLGIVCTVDGDYWDRVELTP